MGAGGGRSRIPHFALASSGPAPQCFCPKLNERLIVKTLSLLCGLALLALAGCATRDPDVATHYHPIDGLRADMTTDNLLDGGGTGREMVWLNASRVFKSHNRYYYYLEVTYAATQATGYLDIQPGQSLLIVADGKEMAFSGSGSAYQRKARGELINESCLYPAEPDQIQALGKAGKVQVKITGRNGRVEREFTPANSTRFRKFAEKFGQ